MQNQQVSPGTAVASHTSLQGPRSYWDSVPHPPFHVLKTPRSDLYDIIVVGAGLAGALVADAVSDGKRSVLVLDRRMPLSCSATTARASLQCVPDLPLAVVSSGFERSTYLRLSSRSAEAIGKMLSLTSRLGVDCEIETRPLLRMAPPQADPEALQAEAAIWRDMGLKARFIARDVLSNDFGIDRPGGLVFETSAIINPVQVAAALLRQATKQGAEIVAFREIIDVREDGGGVHLLTSEGDFLCGTQVIFCTGHEVPADLELPRQPHASTWAIATRPDLALPQWMRTHIVEEAGQTGIHLRATSDGRLLVGMEDEPEAHLSLSPERHEIRSRILADRLAQLTGMEIGEPDFAWSGTVAKPETGVPAVGRVPGMSQVYAATGFGTRQMGLCQIAADVLKSEIQGIPDPDADLFSFHTYIDQPGRLHG